jgi:hypothetical protein
MAESWDSVEMYSSEAEIKTFMNEKEKVVKLVTKSGFTICHHYVKSVPTT